MSTILTELQAAQLLGVSLGWLAKMRRSNLGPRHQILRKSAIYLKSDVEAFRDSTSIPMPTKGRSAVSEHSLLVKFLDSLEKDQRDQLVDMLDDEQRTTLSNLYRMVEYQTALRASRPPRKRTPKAVSGRLEEN